MTDAVLDLYDAVDAQFSGAAAGAATAGTKGLERGA